MSSIENKQTSILKCYCCQALYNESDETCRSCGYPFNGTLEEQKQYSINRTLANYDKVIVKGNVREASIVLIVLALFTIIQGIIAYYKTSITPILWFFIVLGLIYAALGIWAHFKPLPAILIGLFVYTLLMVLTAVISPISILEGWLFKILFFFFMIKGAYSAYRKR